MLKFKNGVTSLTKLTNAALPELASFGSEQPQFARDLARKALPPATNLEKEPQLE
jgi:hypothetical protein